VSRLLAVALIPVFVVRVLFWELVGCGVLIVVGHFVIKEW
jgi:hypothetical protein